MCIGRESVGREQVRLRTCIGRESVGREQVRSRKCIGREQVSSEKTRYHMSIAQRVYAQEITKALRGHRQQRNAIKDTQQQKSGIKQDIATGFLIQVCENLCE